MPALGTTAAASAWALLAIATAQLMVVPAAIIVSVALADRDPRPERVGDRCARRVGDQDAYDLERQSRCARSLADHSTPGAGMLIGLLFARPAAAYLNDRDEARRR